MASSSKRVGSDEDITPPESVVPVFRREETPDEIAERGKREKELDDEKKRDKRQRVDRKSGLAKLAALGLTDDELKALFN